MDELDRYECFGVPLHASMPLAELGAIVMPGRGAVRVVPLDADFLGAEAFHSIPEGFPLDA